MWSGGGLIKDKILFEKGKLQGIISRFLKIMVLWNINESDELWLIYILIKIVESSCKLDTP